MSHSLRRITVPVVMALAMGGSALPAAASSGTQPPSFPSAGGQDANVAVVPPASGTSFPSAGGEDANLASLNQKGAGQSVAAVRVTNPGGFDWGDAGLAAGGIALLIGVGGTVTVARRRRGHAPLPS